MRAITIWLCKLQINHMYMCMYLAIGIVSKSFMGLIEHHTAYLPGRTRPPGNVILHHLRCQEEHSLRDPLRGTLSRGHVACRTHTEDTGHGCVVYIKRERDRETNGQRDGVREGVRK